MDEDPGYSTLGNGLDWEAVGRYFAGESSADEAAAVRAFLERSPRDAAFMGIIGRAAAQLPGTGEPVDVEAALRRVHARLDDSKGLPLVPRRRSPFLMGGGRSPALAVAATLTLLIGGALLWRSMREPAGAAVTAGATQRVTTGVGQRDTIQLADGSTVVLGPMSTLDADVGPAAAERRVTLTGEAYFTVRHDETRRFVVRGGALIIRDVGTQFTVRNARDTPSRVAVTEGVVAVRTADAGDEITLRAGDVAEADADGRVVTRRQAVVQADTAWKGGQLVFADALMSDVRDGVRRWYGVEIRYDSTLARRHVTATFRGEPVERVLGVLALTLGARVEHHGDTASMNAGPARQ